jgi:anti-sigma factor RsiW
MSPEQHPDPMLLVHAYVDGELDPANALEIERQMASDPRLAAERARVEALRRVLDERLPREPLPPHLRARIESAIGSRARTQPSWRALAASVVLAAGLASGSTWLAIAPGPAETTADLVVANHMRGLMASQPIDVTSSDRHTVKPWFNGKIPEAPRVVDLSRQDFPLVGGRIDVVHRTPVPTLVYRYQRHLISLTAVPAGSRAAAGLKMIEGYNVLSWTDDGVTYWAVSDVTLKELEAFAEAFRTAKPE